MWRKRSQNGHVKGISEDLYIKAIVLAKKRMFGIRFDMVFVHDDCGIHPSRGFMLDPVRASTFPHTNFLNTQMQQRR
jgi:hypothetical protein